MEVFYEVENSSSDSESDSEIESVPEVEYPRLPVDPEIWLDLGHGFEILLNYLPSDVEQLVISTLSALLEGRLEELQEPELQCSNEQAIVYERAFYLNGFKYCGLFLTPGEVDQVIEDFFSFFTPNRIWPQEITSVRWTRGEETVFIRMEHQGPEEQQQDQEGQEEERLQQQLSRYFSCLFRTALKAI